MKKAYCTIITLDYLHYALTLNASLLAHDPDVQMKVLVSDTTADLSAIMDRCPNVEFYFADELCKEGIARTIYDKYAAADMDSFRWSMKPVFLMHLLDQGYEQVFFLDCDLYFFAPFNFLSDDLNGCGVLLTPHWRASNPRDDANNFDHLQTDGLFNAGFVGVSKEGRTAMELWATACAHKCKKAPDEGLYVDQAYLNLLPVYFDNIKIEKHRGCNVAEWNRVECRRVVVDGGRVLIQGRWEIIFIHFTQNTIDVIRSGKDRYLQPYLEKYQREFEITQSWVRDLVRIDIKTSAHFESNTSELSDDKARLSNPYLSPAISPGRPHIYHLRSFILRSLKAQLSQFSGVLLDVSSGQMPYKPLLTSPPCRVTRYICIDLGNSPIYDYQPDISWVDGKIALKDNSVDCSICISNFEYCREPEAVMREIFRVLKPGGVFFLAVPFLWPLYEEPYDYYRFTPLSLRRYLAASGYVDIELKHMGGWDASLAQMLGLWVVRRPMGKWTRRIMSRLLLPLIYLLGKFDKQTTKIHEIEMTACLSGTARKPHDGASRVSTQNQV